MIEMFFERYGEVKFCLQAAVPMAEKYALIGRD
jgi:hypothetical protein